MNNGDKNWHALEIESVLTALKSSTIGLSTGEAESRLLRFGFNVLPEKRQRVVLRIIGNQFNNPFAYILAIAGILSLLLGANIDATVVFAALFLNAGIGFFQEWRAFFPKKLLVPILGGQCKK